MTIIGLTGGIGSGKSTVAQVFAALGIPTFNSDDYAKLQYKKEEVQQQVVDRFGSSLRSSETGVDFPKLAKIIFENKEDLKWINSVIHPLVEQDFQSWLKRQNSEVVVKESAILFESGGHEKCDYIISIEANEAERIRRVTQRDGVTSEQVKARIKKQISDQERNENADFVIQSDTSLLLPQIMKALRNISREYDNY